MKVDNKTYDMLKFIAGDIIPILIFLVVSLSELYGFATAGAVISGTLSIIDVALSRLLSKLSKDYAGDGMITMDEDGIGNLELTTPIAEIASRGNATFRVDFSTLTSSLDEDK